VKYGVFRRPVGAGLIGAMLLLASMASAGAEPAPVFRAGPILPAWFARVVAEVAITADSIDSHGVMFTGVELALALDRGVVSSDNLRVKLGGGDVKLAFRHDPGGITNVTARARHIHLADIDAFAEFIRDIPMDIALELTGSGSSAREIAASASGHVKVRSTAAGTIKKLTLAPGNPLYWLLAAVNPFRDENAETPVECLAIELPFMDGASETEDGFELLTQRIRVVAGGRIDLGAESVDVLFKPLPRQGVNLSSLAKGDVVAVQGRLGAPAVKIMSGHVLEKAFSLGRHVATFGTVASRASLCASYPRAVPALP
jgi:hypothetical protein